MNGQYPITMYHPLFYDWRSLYSVYCVSIHSAIIFVICSTSRTGIRGRDGSAELGLMIWAGCWTGWKRKSVGMSRRKREMGVGGRTGNLWGSGSCCQFISCAIDYCRISYHPLPLCTTTTHQLSHILPWLYDSMQTIKLPNMLFLPIRSPNWLKRPEQIWQWYSQNSYIQTWHIDNSDKPSCTPFISYSFPPFLVFD